MGLLVFLLSACSGGSSQQEVDECVAFLYESMPLPDSVDYPREFWEQNVRMALKARKEMPWGEKVPEREWRHFVLPLRVNNENLDSARTVFYDELKDRVKDLSMYQAVLEVNHWCHEHVSYQPSDARTSAPLATIRSAIGRCGEESTFTVTALRAIGIPARQVYTPRWAHTDDNHAWVEAWVDGRWYFLGACEPQPILNLGWFNAPASRGMLMHTKVFGHYEGPEEVVSRTACYTEINVTANYAQIDTLQVRVCDAEGRPVEGAQVDFRLYNYAEFYPIATKQSDAQGRASLACGLGDLIIWACHDGKFGFEQASVGKQDSIVVVLDKDVSYTASMELTLTPPSEASEITKLTPEQQIANRKRMIYEDSIRGAYMKQAFVQNSDDEILVKARANHKAITYFLREVGYAENSVKLLMSLREKDLRDVTPDVLFDHFTNTASSSNPLWQQYVLCPRVANEMLTPYREQLQQVFHGKSVEQIIAWVKDSVRIDESRNPQQLCMSPLGVYRHRTTDAHSRDIFFVSAARSVGIPARIDEVTGKLQWADASGIWHDVLFVEAAQQAPQGTVTLSYYDMAIKENPGYYSHFTLSRIQNGRPQLQEFSESATWASDFSKGVRMDAGQYMLLSGTRLAGGDVLANLQVFNVTQDVNVTVPLRLRESQSQLRVIGSFNSELGFTTRKGDHRSILQTTGRGYFIIGLLHSNHEPSTHALHDFEAANIYLSQWPHCFLMLFPSQGEMDRFDRKEFDDLPSNFVFGVADPETVEAMHIQELSHGSEETPIFILADTFNRVLWYHQGYTIGLGDRVMDTIRLLMLGSGEK